MEFQVGINLDQLPKFLQDLKITDPSFDYSKINSLSFPPGSEGHRALEKFRHNASMLNDETKSENIKPAPLTPKEHQILQDALSKLPHPKDTENFFRKADKDADGFLSYTELREANLAATNNGNFSYEEVSRAAMDQWAEAAGKTHANKLSPMLKKPQNLAVDTFIDRSITTTDKYGKPSGGPGQYTAVGNMQLDNKKMKFIFINNGEDPKAMRRLELLDKDGQKITLYGEDIPVEFEKKIILNP